MSRSRAIIGALVAAGLLSAAGAISGPAARAKMLDQHRTVTVIADNLNNPRGLSPAPGGGLYLAEAGSGGHACFSGGPEGETCFGLTGSFDLVSNKGITRIVAGLISGSDATGVAAEGPVSVSRGPDGTVYGQFGLNSHVLPPKSMFSGELRRAALAQLGHLWLVKPGGSASDVSAVGDRDWTWTSTRTNFAPKDFPDANPNAVLYSKGRRYVADAGANILVDVKHNGHVKVLAFFHVPADSQSDAVPTCAARGPDGALYVGELLGGFYTPGRARIWRVVPGHAPTVWATGLTTVQGCGFGSDGAFYATEFQTGGLFTDNPAGDVVRIGPDGHRTQLGAGKLFFPSGFAAGPGGAIYVSNCSIAPATGMGQHLCPTGGQVVRIR